MKKIVKCILLVCLMASLLSGCKRKDNSLNIAYQYGIAYAPAIIVEQQSLIEKKYKELTGTDISINWIQMSSGSDINIGMMTKDIDVGFMGVAPAITGISKGLEQKIFTNISGQDHGLMTNKANNNTLGDIMANNDQIALVSLGSIQHIILAMALVNNGYDAHALDSNIVGMKHPDGKSSLESGSIACHLTSSPYIDYERENDELYEINEIHEVWNSNKSFIVGITADDIYENEMLYKAIIDSINEAIELINKDAKSAAEITYKIDGNSLEQEIEFLSNGVYTNQTNGLYNLANFMAENGFCEGNFSSYRDLVYDNVEGN